METNDILKEAGKKAGLAVVILLAPGGFILGAALAARHWRKRQAEKADAAPVGANEPCASRVEGEICRAPDSGRAGGGAEGDAT